MVVNNNIVWNPHYNLIGKHATLSPSSYSWLNYDSDKMKTVWINKKRAEQGTRLHALASEMINLKIKPADHKQALNQFVLDCIGFDMRSEQILYYSENVFGTADAIKYDPKGKHLMIFDLKTGLGKVKFDQLLIYAGIFCLEYGIKPLSTTFQLRIYQGRGFEEQIIEPMVIRDVITQIKKMDDTIQSMISEGYQ